MIQFILPPAASEGKHLNSFNLDAATCLEQKRRQQNDMPVDQRRDPPQYLQLGGGNSNIFGIFIPTWGKIPILTNIFQMGWNHQLDKVMTRFGDAANKSFDTKMTTLQFWGYCWWKKSS